MSRIEQDKDNCVKTPIEIEGMMINIGVLSAMRIG
jgi:hypothetical protein